MKIRPGSIHFQILDRLCQMPEAVRGIAPAMLQRQFGDLDCVDDMAAAGLLAKRGWANGPGWIWIPTEAGEALHREMTTTHHQNQSITTRDRVLLPQRSS